MVDIYVLCLAPTAAENEQETYLGTESVLALYG